MCRRVVPSVHRFPFSRNGLLSLPAQTCCSGYKLRDLSRCLFTSAANPKPSSKVRGTPPSSSPACRDYPSPIGPPTIELLSLLSRNPHQSVSCLAAVETCLAQTRHGLVYGQMLKDQRAKWLSDVASAMVVWVVGGLRSERDGGEAPLGRRPCW